MALISTLTDNFDDNSRDTSKWNVAQLHDNSGNNVNVTVIEQNSRLEITPPSGGGTNEYNGYTSINTYDFTGDHIFVQISFSGALTTTTQAILSVGPDSGNNYEAVIQGDGNVYLQKIVSGSFTNISSFAYNSSTHKWLRLRHGGVSDDTIYIDTAPDTASNPPTPTDWVNALSSPRDTGVPITAAHAGLSGGTWGASAGQTTIYFDGFNTATTTSGSVGTSSGAATVSGVGKAQDKGVGSTAGTGAASGVGKSQAKGAGSSAGRGALSGIGKARDTANGTSAGLATVSGRSNGASVGSSAGVGTASGVGKASARGSGSSAGLGTVTGKGLTGLKAAGSSVGFGSLSGQGKARFMALGVSAGLAALSGLGKARAQGVGLSAGTATVSGIPAGIVIKTYPLAGVPQPYPETAPQTYPLDGVSQQYPLQ
jgi:hypothetical protein